MTAASFDTDLRKIGAIDEIELFPKARYTSHGGSRNIAGETEGHPHPPTPTTATLPLDRQATPEQPLTDTSTRQSPCAPLSTAIATPQVIKNGRSHRRRRAQSTNRACRFAEVFGSHATTMLFHDRKSAPYRNALSTLHCNITARGEPQ